MHIITRDNVKFEKPLNSQMHIRVSEDELDQVIVVAKQWNISTSELIRNLIRDHISTYSMSENLSKFLLISNEIDRFLLEKRLISSKKGTNLSKIREILTDFEEFLELPSKKIDRTFAVSEAIRLNGLLKLIYMSDEWLSQKIDTQVRRMKKTKTYKALDIEEGE